MVKQYLVATIRHQAKGESSTPTAQDLQQSRIPVLSIDVVLERASCEDLERVSCEDLERVIISDDKEKFFQVRPQLTPQEKEELMVFLRKNIDVFAWSAYEAPRVDPNLICYHLNVNPAVIP